MRQGIWLSDLTQCRPTDAISRDGLHGTWTAVDYDVDEGNGVMLFGLPKSDIKRLGHCEDLSRWEGKGDDYYRVFPIRRLDGYAMGREFSNPSDG